MRQLFSAIALLFVLTGLGFAPPAQAAVSAADARAVQLVIRAQLDAFADDDAELAFSFASKGIRDVFGTPEQFMLMVRASYPVVYRPATVTFLQPRPDDKLVLQPVRMTDGRGGAWLAMYRLERQPDKSWRIAGCVLVANKAQTT